MLLCQYHSNGAVIDFGRFTCEGWLTWTLAAPSCWLGNHLCTQSASAPLSPYPLWQACVDDAARHSHSFHHSADNSFAAACEMVKHIYCFNRWGLDDSIQEVKRKWWKVNLLMQARYRLIYDSAMDPRHKVSPEDFFYTKQTKCYSFWNISFFYRLPCFYTVKLFILIIHINQI